ncbi:hypothetical protein GCM10018966_044670 [Streptomyces yanii]
MHQVRRGAHDTAPEHEPFGQPDEGLVACRLCVAVHHAGPYDDAEAVTAYGIQIARRAHRAQKPPEGRGAAPAAELMDQSGFTLRRWCGTDR